MQRNAELFCFQSIFDAFSLRNMAAKPVRQHTFTFSNIVHFYEKKKLTLA